MDTKVVVEVVCPHCHSKLMMKKKPEITSQIVKCPGNGCGQELHIVFDVTKDPQTYQIIDDSKGNDKKKKDETVYKKDVGSDKESDIGTQKKKTVYGKDRNKTPHNIYNDIDDDDDEDVKPRKRHRLRERIYLTHITWFGLRNQRFQLYEGTTTIGRYDEDDPSDIMIRGDETMSRKSVAIIIEEGCFLASAGQIEDEYERTSDGSWYWVDDIQTVQDSVMKDATIADGTAVKTPGSNIFPYLQENIDEIITVDDDELIVAFLDMVENHKMVVENSGLLTVAALNHLGFKDKRVVS